MPGQLLGGKYRIEERIAEGGMGVVLRATHLELDCPVAIKLIRPEHADNEEVVARLLTEARIAAGLRSKHVNRVLDVGRTAHGLPYLVLEYMEGSDLRVHLERRGRLPVVEAVDCVMQSCEALAEAHAFGIVHRDLKPENLFLSEDEGGGFVLKVLDFGISKAPAARRLGRTLTNPFEVVGSPNYMAPEQIRGEHVDGRSDVWALGALLYELCSGQVPFAADSVTETFAMILDDRYALPTLDAGPGSEHLALVIGRCLSKDPNERYQSVVELADALSPLGSDMLEGRRVAKVAMATRARVNARAQGTGGATSATPLALSTGLEPELHIERETPSRRWPSKVWMAAGVVAAAMLALGFRIAGPDSSSQRATQPTEDAAALEPDAALSRAAAVERPPASRTEERPSAASPAAIAATPPTPAAAPAPAKKAKPYVKSWRPRAAAPDYALATAPAPVHSAPEPTEPTETTETTEPTASPEPPVVASSPEPQPDAWDPKTFGGRR